MARLLISFDFELGWGVLEHEAWRRRESAGVYRRMRDDVPRVLALLKRHEIPTTWGVVSNMLAGDAQHLDIEHLPGDYADHLRHFYSHAEDATKNGADLFEQVLRMGRLCEIASHSASHIYGLHPTVTAEQFTADVMQSFDVLERESGAAVRSFIFPRDQAGFRAELARARSGLVMRLNPGFSARKGGAVKRAVAAGAAFFQPVPAGRVIVGPDDAIYQQASFNFNAAGGRYKQVRQRLLKTRISRLLSQLASGRKSDVFHLWLHPFNLSEYPINERLFSNFIERLAGLRETHGVEVLTMSDLAAMADVGTGGH